MCLMIVYCLSPSLSVTYTGIEIMLVLAISVFPVALNGAWHTIGAPQILAVESEVCACLEEVRKKMVDREKLEMLYAREANG